MLLLQNSQIILVVTIIVIVVYTTEKGQNNKAKAFSYYIGIQVGKTQRSDTYVQLLYGNGV